jgi:hypothetical protein
VTERERIWDFGFNTWGVAPTTYAGVPILERRDQRRSQRIALTTKAGRFTERGSANVETSDSQMDKTSVIVEAREYDDNEII